MADQILDQREEAPEVHDAAADSLHPADLADHLENLSPEKRAKALSDMSAEDAADALAELEGG
ncbi:MAG: magnesium transporter, partial [Desulfovibrio sp.]|nr:magnesium transporter [Desulfovibrio sp.]